MNFQMHLYRQYVAENDTEKSQVLWKSLLQKKMLRWKNFSAIWV